MAGASGNKYHRLRMAVRRGIDRPLQPAAEACRAPIAELETTKRQFAAFFDHVPFGLMLADRTGKVLALNPAMHAMLGYDAHELEQLGPGAVTHPDDFLADAELFADLLAGEREDYRLEKRFYDRQGRLIWGALAVSVVRHGLGPDWFVVTLEDIGDRKREVLALAESERRFRTLANHAPVLIWMANAMGERVFVNQPWLDFTGRALAHELNTVWSDGLHPDDREPCLQTLKEAFEGHHGFTLEARLMGADGQYHWMLKGGVPRFLDDGTFIGMVGTCLDITDQKAIEERLREQNLRLKELDTLKNAFLSTVSHEFRTPLMTILGYTEFLEDDMSDSGTPAQRDYLAQIKEGTDRLKRMVDDLLDFTRLESGSMVLDLREFDLGQHVSELIEMAGPHAEQAAVLIEFGLPAEPVLLCMDADRVGQVLANLLDNALKFTPPGGRVQVSVSRLAELARVEVRDTGIGIPAEHLPHLFEKFYQVDPSLTREHGGTGLGLTLCKALIEAHGGQIGVESAPGEGTRVWFTLPIGPRTALRAPVSTPRITLLPNTVRVQGADASRPL